MRPRTLRRYLVGGLALTLLGSLGACRVGSTSDAKPESTVAASIPGHTPSALPSHRAKRVRHRPPPVRHVSRRFLGASWHPGCPVPPSDLRALRIYFYGFDGRPHVGTLVVNADAVSAVRSAFRSLTVVHFPIRRMRPVTAYGASDSKSVRHDNTSAFNCRYAVAPGPKHWSEHAYGEAIDLNPFENPYVLDGKVLPRAAARFADRTTPRRGVILSDGVAVRAFASVGWQWGGRWSAPDYQHFSVNGR